MVKKILKGFLITKEQKKFTQINFHGQNLEWNKKAKIIQSKFNFILPDYIIDEIIKNEEKKDYLNLNYLINLAVINGRISKDNGKLIKKTYNII